MPITQGMENPCSHERTRIGSLVKAAYATMAYLVVATWMAIQGSAHSQTRNAFLVLAASVLVLGVVATFRLRPVVRTCVSCNESVNTRTGEVASLSAPVTSGVPGAPSPAPKDRETGWLGLLALVVLVAAIVFVGGRGMQSCEALAGSNYDDGYGDSMSKEAYVFLYCLNN